MDKDYYSLIRGKDSTHDIEFQGSSEGYRYQSPPAPHRSIIGDISLSSAKKSIGRPPPSTRGFQPLNSSSYNNSSSIHYSPSLLPFSPLPPGYALNECQFRLGERVLVDSGKSEGTLKFYGPVKFQKGLWAGVELDFPHGKNNGSVEGVQYFHCRNQHGIFVSVHRITHSAISPSSLSTLPLLCNAVTAADHEGLTEISFSSPPKSSFARASQGFMELTTEANTSSLASNSEFSLVATPSKKKYLGSPGSLSLINSTTTMTTTTTSLQLNGTALENSYNSRNLQILLSLNKGDENNNNNHDTSLSLLDLEPGPVSSSSPSPIIKKSSTYFSQQSLLPESPLGSRLNASPEVSFYTPFPALTSSKIPSSEVADGKSSPIKIEVPQNSESSKEPSSENEMHFSPREYFAFSTPNFTEVRKLKNLLMEKEAFISSLQKSKIIERQPNDENSYKTFNQQVLQQDYHLPLIEVCKEELKASQTQVLLLRQSLESSEREKKEWTLQKSALQQSLVLSNDQNKENLQKTQALLSENTQLKTNLEKSSYENVQLKTNLDKLTSENAQLNLQTQALQHGELENIQKQKDFYTAQLYEKDQELQNQKSFFERQALDLNSQVKFSQEQSFSDKIKLENLENEAQILNKTMQELDNDLFCLSEKNKELNEHLIQEREYWTQERDDLTLKCGDLTLKYDDLTLKYDDLTLKYDDLTQRNENLTKTNDDLTQKNDDLTQENTRFSIKTSLLETQAQEKANSIIKDESASKGDGLLEKDITKLIKYKQDLEQQCHYLNGLKQDSCELLQKILNESLPKSSTLAADMTQKDAYISKMENIIKVQSLAFDKKSQEVKVLTARLEEKEELELYICNLILYLKHSFKSNLFKWIEINDSLSDDDELSGDNDDDEDLLESFDQEFNNNNSAQIKNMIKYKTRELVNLFKSPSEQEDHER